jgi:hypothetical protein
VCTYYGAGQFARDVPPLAMAKGIKVCLSALLQVIPILTDCMELFYIAEYFYAVSAMFIKISVAVALLRIAAGRPLFMWGLWGLIGITVVAAVVFVVGIANICESNFHYNKSPAHNQTGYPINTLWGESKGTCNLQLNTNVSLFFSAVEIVTDFSLSIMPAILLWDVQMVSPKSIEFGSMPNHKFHEQ